jgi:Raf kinase inhibitor-like YbhB/YbcL family protein
MSIRVTSDAFGADQPIPKDYTDDGRDVSPPLRWDDVPPETAELALIVDDPDAPTAEPFVHWVMYKIPADAPGLSPDVPRHMRPTTMPGAYQGRTSFDKIGYGGPAPPRGHGTHHYRFHVYALDAALEVRPGLNKPSLLAAMSGHVLDEGELVGTYAR